MGKRVDLDRFSHKKKKPSGLNFSFVAKMLLKILAQKTGVNLRYGSITFNYHNGECVNIDAKPAFRIHENRPTPPVVKMKLVGSK